jgi:propanol-preferring alcohol dehydrogenase
MRVARPGSPLELREVDRPSPEPGQLVIRVEACGVCRTDLHVADGELTEPRLPIILGHQIVGVVDELGEGASGFAVGDRVGVPWLGRTCGGCRYCAAGRENLCADPRTMWRCATAVGAVCRVAAAVHVVHGVIPMRKILFGTDFSTAADAALVQAVNLARREERELVIAHVRPDRSRIAEALRDLYDEDEDTAGDAVGRELRARCERARIADVPAREAVLTGDPAEALTDLAAKIDAETLVVGSLGKTGLERFLLGSIAEACIRQAPCRVLIARGDTGARNGYRDILVATDFSAAADAALASATELVVADGRVELLHVMTPPAAMGAGFGTGPVSPAINDKLRDSVEAACAERIDRHRSVRAQLAHTAVFGPIAATILDKLEERAFDLVALGSRGGGGLSRALLGSVAEKVVRHAPCSALVYPELATAGQEVS